MSLNHVDLNLFPVLDVIYRERNLTRAAEVLCLTQPTVSNALARLRRSLNDELFVRTPTGMVPTPLTENIIGQVRDALQLLDRSVMDGDVFNPATSERTFRISMPDSSEAHLLPALMNDLGQNAPGMSIESYHVNRSDMLAAMTAGNLDLAMDIAFTANPQLRYAPVFEEQYVCLLSKKHPMKGERLSLEQYLDLAHVHVSSRSRGMGPVDLELNKLGLKRKIQMRLEHYLVATEIVRNSHLALTIPGSWTALAGLRVMALPFEVPSLQTQLVWHKSVDGDKANQWLRDRIIKLCA